MSTGEFNVGGGGGGWDKLCLRELKHAFVSLSQLQSWWRGTMVRKQLGPYSKKKKKKGKKGKKSGKKGGKKKKK